MIIDLHEILKKSIKDALTEWVKENKYLIEGIHSKQENGTNLLTVKQFCQKHPFISEAGMRHKLFYREYNGMDKCISSSKRKVLIKEKEILEYFANPPPNASWTYNENKYKTR